METHRWNSYWAHWVLHVPFVRLIHKVPNINSSIWLSYEENSGSGGTPTSTSMVAPFAHHTGKDGNLDISLPHTKVVIIDSKDDIFIAWEQIKSNNRPKTSFLVPISSDGLIFTPSFVCWTSCPVTDKKFSLIGCSRKNWSFLILLEHHWRTSHLTSSFRPEQVKSVSCLPWKLR